MPELTAPVNDFAHVIDASSAQRMDQIIRALQAAIGDTGDEDLVCLVLQTVEIVCRSGGTCVPQYLQETLQQAVDFGMPDG